MTVGDVYRVIDSLAPFESQADFDNSGLLTGTRDQTVRGIHVALDVTQRVIDEAEAAGANLIVTHHPLMFSARKTMTEEDCEGRLLCRLIRARIALIAAHTCLDSAPGGINDVLAERLGLRDVGGTGYLRVGTLPDGLTAESVAEHVARRLSTTVRVMGQLPPERPVRRMAVSSGAGGDSWEEAAALGAEVFVSGEIKHHHALAMADAGMLALEAGHFATEEPGIFALADALQTASNRLEWKVHITKSRCGGYAAPGAAGR